jgi:hypothetical protein
MSVELLLLVLLLTTLLWLYAFVELAFKQTTKKREQVKPAKAQLSCPYCGYEYETEFWVLVKN